MKKHIVSALAAASMFAATTPVAQATDLAPEAFNVTVSLTSACDIDTGISTDLDFGTYAAITGGASVPAPTTTFTIKCTRNFTPASFTFDAAGGGTDGVVAGLNYTLSAADALTTGGTGATPGVAGTADIRTVTITGGMAANQAGDSTAATTDARTLMVSF